MFSQLGFTGWWLGAIWSQGYPYIRGAIWSYLICFWVSIDQNEEHHDSQTSLVIWGNEPKIQPQVCTFALAAFDEVEITVSWDSVDASLNLTITGEFVKVNSVSQFYDDLLEGIVNMCPTLQCGSRIDINRIRLRLVPRDNTAMIPPVPLFVLLVVRGTRALLNIIEVTNGLEIQLMWLNRVVWKGQVPRTTSIQQIMSFLRLSCAHGPIQIAGVATLGHQLDNLLSL